MLRARMSRSDLLANALLFVPIGFMLAGAILVDRRSRRLRVLATLLTLLSSAAVSSVLEFLQIFAPGRVPSPIDIMAQVLGCTIGLVAWMAGGDAVTRWLRAARQAAGEDRLSSARWVLSCVVVRVSRAVRHHA